MHNGLTNQFSMCPCSHDATFLPLNCVAPAFVLEIWCKSSIATAFLQWQRVTMHSALPLGIHCVVTSWCGHFHCVSTLNHCRYIRGVRFRLWKKNNGHHRAKCAVDISHYRSLERIIKEDKPAIIVEDDAIFPNRTDWYGDLLRTLQELPQVYLLFSLATSWGTSWIFCLVACCHFGMLLAYNLLHPRACHLKHPIYYFCHVILGWLWHKYPSSL